MRHHIGQTRESLTPQKALEFLKEGNTRFCNNLSYKRDFMQTVTETTEGQWPFAAILSCSDSRVVTELVFDQGLGDIFSIRLAGNIASQQAIASMEYTCKVLGSKLVVVLGHTSCGAVKAACDGVEMGHLGSLTKMIDPAITAETETTENRTSGNKKFLDNVLHNNVHHQIQTIVGHSQIIREMLEKGEIGIIGGIYDISTGCVEFFDEMFDLESNLESVSKAGAV
ncbi:carbonic anhydrase [Daejeonella lutea]|uniref:Carbonic anhydrase n=1 Tax=Daejeonella lutea TaxID=572036 RepID=A0A1T5C2U6_9SPHI|nr:carbonic anhydrase [Daejeonella lutea]SKB53724.1 carbonic anhydrase [Daejeonella lutea]